MMIVLHIKKMNSHVCFIFVVVFNEYECILDLSASLPLGDEVKAIFIYFYTILAKIIRVFKNDVSTYYTYLYTYSWLP